MLLPQVVVQMSTTDAMSTTNVSKTIPYHLYHPHHPYRSTNDHQNHHYHHRSHRHPHKAGSPSLELYPLGSGSGSTTRSNVIPLPLLIRIGSFVGCWTYT